MWCYYYDHNYCNLPVYGNGLSKERQLWIKNNGGWFAGSPCGEGNWSGSIPFRKLSVLGRAWPLTPGEKDTVGGQPSLTPRLAVVKQQRDLDSHFTPILHKRRVTDGESSMTTGKETGLEWVGEDHGTMGPTWSTRHAYAMGLWQVEREHQKCPFWGRS